MSEHPAEYKIIALRDCPTPEAMTLCDNDQAAAAYWRTHIATDPRHNPEVECLIVLCLNTRRKIKGHYLVSTGTMDSILAHPREVFRTAIVASSHSIIVMHNHPSGDQSPSEADIKVTRDLARAGQLLRIDLMDHVIMGHSAHSSLRALGYLYL